MSQLQEKMSSLNAPTVRFNTLSARQKRNDFRDVNDAFSEFLEKTVGDEKEDQAAFLLYYLRRIYPSGSHFAVAVDDLETMKDQSTLSKTERRGRQTTQRTLEKIIFKFSGSEDPETHADMLNVRYTALHKDKENFKSLRTKTSWQAAKAMIVELKEVGHKIPYSELSNKQKSRPGRRVRHEILENMIEICGGSTEISQQELMLNVQLKRMHFGHNAFTQKRLSTFIDELPALEKYDNSPEQKTKHRYKYPIIKKLVNKLIGYSNSESKEGYKSALSQFLRSQFPHSYQLTWATILNSNYWQKLVQIPSKKSPFIRKLKELIERFTGGEIENFLLQQWPKLKLKQPTLNRLKKLSNAIETIIKKQECSRELSHLYTNLLACVVSSGKIDVSGKSSTPHTSHDDFKVAGWKFGKHRYAQARKRQREETFTDLLPAKRGRVSISDELKRRIIEEWEDNARPAAKLEVVNPKDKKDVRPGLRLRLPALQVALQCSFVKTNDNPSGENFHHNFS